jgi:hypothetical protein
MRRTLQPPAETSREKELNHLLWVNLAVIAALIAVLLILRA